LADYSTIRAIIGLKSQPATSRRTPVLANEVSIRPGIPFGEDVFELVLMLERRRAERSRRPFMLMLLHSKERSGLETRILEQALSILMSNTRESDLIGWYRESVTLGIIFTETSEGEKAAIAEALLQKVESALVGALGAGTVSKISISMHVFPEDWDRENSRWVGDSKLYPELRPKLAKRHVHLGLKRAIDIAGSAVILLIMLPFLAVIALIIKLTSEGPVLFEQERLGQRGVRFKCLKFRTMYTNCDPKIHREYVQQFIAGNAEKARKCDSDKVIYKLTADPRVTPIGRFLRETSLDEFPQFWNVLRGEMSIVGPRPPVPYEFEVYDIWHRRRVLELKPGVTGLWQVSGRNRMRFDDMVRLDLRYSQKWSLWLDLKIIFATPWALISGDCA
jgi:lipopolysaccharide/colanic/teichoic acid biosynthesis glycosyltransferase